ncbi:MAG: geranylgeranylglyceryl/heptaprenylglyceryl phosphate synthase [Bacteroidales bacterium]|nr:geranylgeranylglyceryl/heptaprenylglyceryl phosphate synthase [Bacteroidales bacterium]
MNLLTLIEEPNTKKIALLIDPDKCNESSIERRISLANEAGIHFIFVGGSLLNYYTIDSCIQKIKSFTQLPVVLFPANGMHISSEADAILFLSLISGRNADLLIGNHVHSASIIRKFGLEAIPTGYMIVESGNITTAQYMSNSMPLPRNKPEVAVSTAIAGEMLGLKALYLDAGSGASLPIPEMMIAAVRKAVSIPILVGGGLRTIDAVENAFKAGANVIVLGNIVEDQPEFLLSIKKLLD